eukprot:393968-Pelagomonas_calceolata.AAC.7
MDGKLSRAQHTARLRHPSALAKLLEWAGAAMQPFPFWQTAQLHVCVRARRAYTTLPLIYMFTQAGLPVDTGALMLAGKCTCACCGCSGEALPSAHLNMWVLLQDLHHLQQVDDALLPHAGLEV